MYTLRSFIVLVALLGTVKPVSAKPLVAVLDFGESRTGLHADELSVLGDVSRGAALRALGHQYDVITRENLVDLLKAHGKNLSQCSGECETETGRHGISKRADQSQPARNWERFWWQGSHHGSSCLSQD